MYTIDKANSLYFFPPKLTMSAFEKASDCEKRNRWFPGSDASVVLSRVQCLGQPGLPMAKAVPSKVDVDQRDTAG